MNGSMVISGYVNIIIKKYLAKSIRAAHQSLYST